MEISFFGRRKGRQISSTSSKLLKDFSYKFYLQEDQVYKLKINEYNKNILEIGFGNGENLVNMSLKEPNNFFIGCDAYRNGCVKLLKEIVKNFKLDLSSFHQYPLVATP